MKAVPPHSPKGVLFKYSDNVTVPAVSLDISKFLILGPAAPGSMGLYGASGAQGSLPVVPEVVVGAEAVGKDDRSSVAIDSGVGLGNSVGLGRGVGGTSVAVGIAA